LQALSPKAQDDYAYLRGEAVGVAQVRPTLEAVLSLKPDLVVRSYGGGAEITGGLARANIRVAQLGFANDFVGIRDNISTIAAALHHPERGAALIARMNDRLAAVPPPTKKVTTLYVTPGGVTAGAGTLVDAMFSAAGLVNLETRTGWPSLPLERLAYENPDLVAAGFFGSRQSAVDAWSPARHPVAARRLQARNAVGIQGAWTACGGWFVLDAVEVLARARVALEAGAAP
jgi:iron complex transport system substrate-binding protein